MIEYDVAVMYTDGSDNKYGSGSGIHAYCYNLDKVPDIVKGYKIKNSMEVLTDKGYANISSVNLPEAVVGEDYDVWNCQVPLNRVTAQVAELTAFIACFKSAPFTAKKYYIISDSAYMLNSVTLWIDGWKRNNWRKADGSLIQNPDVIKTISNIKDDLKSRGISIELIKIKGHSGRYGNELADSLANKASAQCVNSNVEYKPQWSKFESITLDASNTEEIDLVNIGLPSILTHKYHYLLTNEPDDMHIKIDGKEYYPLLSGNHAKNKDDLALLGRYIPDAMFSMTLHENKIEILNTLANYHYDLAWNSSDVLEEYDTIAILHGEHLKRKKVIDFAKRNNFIKSLIPLEDNNALFFDDLLISKLARPPLLTYRALDIREELLKYITLCLEGNDNIVALTDITDMLFDDDDKPTKDFYQKVDRSFNINAKTVDGNTIKVVLSKDIDIPGRTELNRIKEPNGKFYIATFKIDHKWYKYCVFYKGENVHGLWIGYYSANRIIE